MGDKKEMCRLCRKYDANTLSLLNEKGNNGIKLCEMVKTTCGIQISPRDGLPTSACRICVWSLNSSFSFVSQCKRSENWFRSSYSVTTGKAREGNNFSGEIRKDVKRETQTPQRDTRVNYLFIKKVDVKKVEPKKKESQIKEEKPSSPCEKPEEEPVAETVTLVEDEDDRKEENRDDDDTDNGINDDGGHKSDSSWKFSDDEGDKDSDYSPAPPPAQKVKDKGSEVKKKVVPQEFVCDTCGGKFTDKFYLTHHIHKEVIDGKTKIAYKCPSCQRIYLSKENFKAHVNAHEGIYTNICELCGKSFLSNGSLKAHLKIHRGELPFECEICHKKFRRMINVQLHQTVHTRERKYTCDICGKLFAGKSGLRAHLLIHAGDKRYECSVCNKRFTGRRDMLDHERTHTGERPFKCHYCDRSFSQRNCLRGHMKTHSECITYDCEICRRKYLKLVSLKAHMETHMKSKDRRNY